MAKPKKLHKNVIIKQFKNHTIRCLIVGKNIFIPIADIARIANVINYWDRDNGVYSTCSSTDRIVFYNDGTTLWSIEPHDIVNFCKIGKHKLSKSDNEFIEWVKELPKLLDESDKESSTGVKIFNYQDAPISFESRNGNIMINATQMAKPFGDSKRAKNWLLLNSTNEFLDILSKGRNLPLADLVEVTKGGSLPGTWMHEDVAMEFARWLSPSFAIWCNDRIKELITHGMTALPDTLDQMINDPDLIIGLATKIKEERKAKELAIKERDMALIRLESQTVNVNRMQPKEEYYDAVIEKKTNYSTCSIAGELGISYPTLRNQLYKSKIITSLKGCIDVHPDYKDWVDVFRDHTCNKNFLRWTKTGREGIFKLINPQMPK